MAFIELGLNEVVFHGQHASILREGTGFGDRAEERLDDELVVRTAVFGGAAVVKDALVQNPGIPIHLLPRLLK